MPRHLVPIAQAKNPTFHDGVLCLLRRPCFFICHQPYLIDDRWRPLRELLPPENRTQTRSTYFGFDLSDPHRTLTS